MSDPTKAPSEPAGASEPDEATDTVILPTTELAMGPVPVPLGPKDVLRHFLAGRNPRTLAAYAGDLARFADWYGAGTTDEAAAKFLAAGPQHAHATALAWLNSMSRLAPATRARRLASLRSFVDLAGQLGVVTWSLRLRGPKVKKFRDTRGPTPDQLQRVLAACGNDLEGRRNRALVILMSTLGLRRLEVSLLSVEDYDRNGRRLRVFGKGRDGEAEWMTFPTAVARELDAWLCMSRGFGCGESSTDGDRDGSIFFALDNRRRERLTPNGIYFILRELGARVGIRLRPHGLRHAAITSVLDESNGNTRMAQSFGRHADPRTTGAYDDNRRDLAGEAAELVARKLLSKT